MNFVAAMVHPYWQNGKYGNSSWRKLCFFCYQNANHEMLFKSQHCLSYVEKCEEVMKCIEMKARLWFTGSILARCHGIKLPSCISYILHKELSIAKWTWNVSNLRYLYTQIIRKQQSPSLWIDTGFDWNWVAFYPDAVMIWWRDKYLPSSRNFVTYTLSV